MSTRRAPRMLLALVLFIAGVAPAALASPFAEGVEAYNRQDYRQARKHLEIAAKQGDIHAHGLLGRIAFFYGEYELARRHLEQAAGDQFDSVFLKLLENPFAGRFGTEAEHLEGPSRRGNYYLTTDIGATARELRGLKKGRTTRCHQQVATLLDHIHYEYSRRFTLPRDKELVSRVIVFADRAEYLAWSQEVFEKDARESAAYYDPNTRLLVVSASRAGRATEVDAHCQSSIFHEAFHQFIHFYMTDCPYWFNEGVAEYFAPSQQVRGKKRLKVGVLEKPDPKVLSSLEVVKDAIRKGTYTPLPKLLQMDGDAFMANAQLHYPQAWSVVHFLAHGLGKNGAKTVNGYFRLLAEGKSAAEAYQACFGRVDMTRLETAWKEYVLAL